MSTTSDRFVYPTVDGASAPDRHPDGAWVIYVRTQPEPRKADDLPAPLYGTGDYGAPVSRHLTHAAVFYAAVLATYAPNAYAVAVRDNSDAQSWAATWDREPGQWHIFGTKAEVVSAEMAIDRARGEITGKPVTTLRDRVTAQAAAEEPATQAQAVAEEPATQAQAAAEEPATQAQAAAEEPATQAQAVDAVLAAAAAHGVERLDARRMQRYAEQHAATYYGQRGAMTFTESQAVRYTSEAWLNNRPAGATPAYTLKQVWSVMEAIIGAVPDMLTYDDEREQYAQQTEQVAFELAQLAANLCKAGEYNDARNAIAEGEDILPDYHDGNWRSWDDMRKLVDKVEAKAVEVAPAPAGEIVVVHVDGDGARRVDVPGLTAPVDTPEPAEVTPAKPPRADEWPNVSVEQDRHALKAKADGRVDWLTVPVFRANDAGRYDDALTMLMELQITYPKGRPGAGRPFKELAMDIEFRKGTGKSAAQRWEAVDLPAEAEPAVAEVPALTWGDLVAAHAAAAA